MQPIKLLFSKEPQVWKPALISAYRHLAEDRMRVETCANSTHDLLQFTQNALSGQLQLHISQTSPDEFAHLVFSNLKDECKITFKADFERVKQCITLTQTHSPDNASGLTLTDMWCLLKGLAFTLLYHPTFFDESRRENMIALMADRVVEDVNGPWPSPHAPQENRHLPSAEPAVVQNSIQRVHKTTLREAWAYIKRQVVPNDAPLTEALDLQKMPVDEWLLHIDGVPCRVLNHWENGHCQLIVHGEVVAESDEKLAVTGKSPLLTAHIQGTSSQPHKVEVFFRTILSANIRVCVNGRPIQKKFI